MYMDFVLYCIPVIRFCCIINTVNSNGSRSAFPLETKKRTYTYIYNFGRSPLLMAITMRNLDALEYVADVKASVER